MENGKITTDTGDFLEDLSMKIQIKTQQQDIKHG
jgi:hypothetical protein